MYCNQCGSELDIERQRFCCTCGKPVPVGENIRGAVSKGKLIAVGYPYVKQCRTFLAAAIILAAFFVLVGYVNGWWLVEIFAAWCIFCFGVLWCIPGFIVRQVRIYENGLERRMARDLRDRRMFLPWSAVQQYRWDGDILRFQWGENAFLLFRGGEPASNQPLNGVKPGIGYDFVRPSFHYGFPTEVQVPAEKMAAIQLLLRSARPSY